MTGTPVTAADTGALLEPYHVEIAELYEVVSASPLARISRVGKGQETMPAPCS